MAYTLISNPGLIQYTASNLVLKEKKWLLEKRKRLLLLDALSETSSMLGQPNSTPSCFTPTQPSSTPDQPSSAPGQLRSILGQKVEAPRQNLGSCGGLSGENPENLEAVPVKLKEDITRPELAGETT